MRPNLGQVDETVDLAQQVVVRNAPLQTEAVEQRLLHHPPFAHHRPNLLHPAEENQRPAPQSSGVFQRNSSTPAAPGHPLGGQEAKVEKMAEYAALADEHDKPWWWRLVGWIRTRRGRAARKRLRERL